MFDVIVTVHYAPEIPLEEVEETLGNMDALASYVGPNATWDVSTVDRNNPWTDDRVQFARLLSAIDPILDSPQVEKAARTLGIPVDAVQELFQRAATLWQRQRQR